MSVHVRSRRYPHATLCGYLITYRDVSWATPREKRRRSDLQAVPYEHPTPANCARCLRSRYSNTKYAVAGRQQDEQFPPTHRCATGRRHRHAA